VLNKAISEEVSQLTTQAYSAGMSLSLNNQQGLTLVTTGFSDKQFDLQLSAFNKINKIQLTKQLFERYKEIIKDSLVNKTNNALYTQAFDYYRTFLNTGEYSTESLLNALNNLTLIDYENFSKEYFNAIKINTFVYGNFEQSQSVNFINSTEKMLNTKVNNSPLYYKQYYQLNDHEQVNIAVNAQQNDVAIIDAKWQKHTIAKEATGLLLAKIVSPALFKQIRTEEQLGYSVGFYSAVRGKQISYAWYIQTPVKSPIDMLARFDAFKRKFNTEISTLNTEKLEQYRQAILVYLTQKPKNIFEEQQENLHDWNIGNLHFDSKQKLIEAIKHVSVEAIQQLYSQVNDPNQLSRVLVQIKGKNFADSPFVKLKVSQ
jgi:protease-3